MFTVFVLVVQRPSAVQLRLEITDRSPDMLPVKRDLFVSVQTRAILAFQGTEFSHTSSSKRKLMDRYVRNRHPAAGRIKSQSLSQQEIFNY